MNYKFTIILKLLSILTTLIIPSAANAIHDNIHGNGNAQGGGGISSQEIRGNLNIGTANPAANSPGNNNPNCNSNQHSHAVPLDYSGISLDDNLPQHLYRWTSNLKAFEKSLDHYDCHSKFIRHLKNSELERNNLCRLDSHSHRIPLTYSAELIDSANRRVYKDGIPSGFSIHYYKKHDINGNIIKLKNLECHLKSIKHPVDELRSFRASSTQYPDFINERFFRLSQDNGHRITTTQECSRITHKHDLESKYNKMRTVYNYEFYGDFYDAGIIATSPKQICHSKRSYHANVHTWSHRHRKYGIFRGSRHNHQNVQMLYDTLHPRLP